jgi:hypothetical protein
MSGDHRKQAFKHGIDVRSSSARLKKVSDQIRKEKRGLDIKRFRGSEKGGHSIDDALERGMVFSHDALQDAITLCGQVTTPNS